MFNQYDLIRWQAQRYNVQLEALYVPPSLDSKPTWFEQAVATLKNAFMGVNAKPTERDAVLSRGATAWRQVQTALAIGRDRAYLNNGALPT